MIFKEAIKVEGGLMIGDILRTTSHSGIVYSVGGDGSLYFAEAWGGSNNLIKIGGRFADTSTNLTLDPRLCLRVPLQSMVHNRL